jgi:hypothetical protein
MTTLSAVGWHYERCAVVGLGPGAPPGTRFTDTMGNLLPRQDDQLS